jgi:hypothetical protein
MMIYPEHKYLQMEVEENSRGFFSMPFNVFLRRIGKKNISPFNGLEQWVHKPSTTSLNIFKILGR